MLICFSFLTSVLTNRIAKGYKTHGPIVRLWFGIFPFFVVFDPEHLQVILGSQKHTEKSFFYKLLHNFLGDGLITSSGEKWLMHRKLLTPTFHLSILEKFVGTFADSAQCLYDKLKDHDEINITSFINECVLDILNGKTIIRYQKLIFTSKARICLQNQYLVFPSTATSPEWKILPSGSKLQRH